MSIFSGSYSPEDIEFLLSPGAVELTPVAAKEALLQSGVRHYSDMLSPENPPTGRQLQIYRQALQKYGDRLARESLALAQAIASRHQKTDNLVLASLARAGCPLGVLLARALKLLGFARVRHYGVSIIRDRGLDRAAWEILRACPAQNLYFVDGWTGKGAIAGELDRFMAGRPHQLAVLADLCGMAEFSASREDWLIPFGILGAPISGLISRTVWSETGFHKCLLWRNMRDLDESSNFINYVASLWQEEMIARSGHIDCCPDAAEKHALAKSSRDAVAAIMSHFGIDSPNRVKPGIAEATRALLRRLPDCVLARDRYDPDLQLLLELAESAHVPVLAGWDTGPYKAVTLIRKVGAEGRNSR